MSKPPFLELPPGVRAYRLETTRGEFAVHDAGTAERGTALLLPGFTGSKEDFIGLLQPLTEAGFRVVAVDQRGQYETSGPRAEAAYAQAELARDVHSVARALGQDQPGTGAAGAKGPRPLHLLGHSLGGLVARAAVLRDPAPFSSLTLMSSGPAAVAPSQRQRVEMLLAALPALGMEAIWQAMRELDQSPGEAGEAPWPDAKGPEDAEDAEGAEVSQAPRDAEDPGSATEVGTPSAVDAFLHRRWLAGVPEQLSATGRQLLSEPDRVGELAALDVAVHVVSGAVDDAWPVPWLDDMAVRLGARRTVVAGAGHSPNAERPHATARALADFWSSLSPCPGRTA